MVFSGIPFLFYFYPAVLILYFLSPRKIKNYVLLVSSLFFYAWGEPKYVFLMTASILLAYIFALLIEKHRSRRISKLWLTLSLLSGFGFLAYFKYADFFIENINMFTNLNLPMLKIALPVGISFYTFQVQSYVVDVYRADTHAQKNPFTLATYVALFPQLIAGPIVRYVDVEKDLVCRKANFGDIHIGIARFLIGLAKKVILANNLGKLCDVFMSSDEKSLLFYWLYAISFSLQIYFDFSGYSDMAIGMGKIFGFNFLENFNYPYISKSVTEFWRRWHMSLGSWFRDYVYIPLGGNRVSPLRWILNILVVWMLTGLWHGAAWNFVVWGLLFAILLIVEKFWLGSLLKKLPSFFSQTYVLLVVVLSMTLFNARSNAQAFKDISSLLGFASLPLVTAESLYYLRSYCVLLIIAALGCTPLPRYLANQIKGTALGAHFFTFAEPVILSFYLLLSTAYLVDGSFNPFLYFRF